jgi:hypothetical protein
MDATELSRSARSGSLKENERMGTGVASPVSREILSFGSFSEGCEPTARVIEEHEHRAAEDRGGNDKFSQHVVGDRRATVRMTSIPAVFNLSIPSRSESRGSMQVATAIFGCGRPPSFKS